MEKIINIYKAEDGRVFKETSRRGTPYWSPYNHRREVVTTISRYINGILQESYEEVREANHILVWDEYLRRDVKEYLE